MTESFIAPQTHESKLPVARSPSGKTPVVGQLDALSHGRLWDWLNEGLRSGRPGRLAAEYPLALRRGSSYEHIHISRAERPLSHCLVKSADVVARSRVLRMSMVGLVYTEPKMRGQGMARRCLDACKRWALSDSSGLIALWAGDSSFYEKQGFLRGGREHQITAHENTCFRAIEDQGIWPEVRDPLETDFEILEALYAQKPVYVRRPAGSLRLLSTIPDCRMRVAIDGNRPIAYAALGRGDDFPRMIHEWAGTTPGVLACTKQLAADIGELPTGEGPDQISLAPPIVISSPAHEDTSFALRRAGGHLDRTSFAMLSLIDAQRVWREITCGIDSLTGLALRDAEDAPYEFILSSSRGESRLDHRQALDLLFASLRPPEVDELLSSEERSALDEHLPWPVFAWGFDSI